MNLLLNLRYSSYTNVHGLLYIYVCIFEFNYMTLTVNNVRESIYIKTIVTVSAFVYLISTFNIFFQYAIYLITNNEHCCVTHCIYRTSGIKQ